MIINIVFVCPWGVATDSCFVAAVHGRRRCILDDVCYHRGLVASFILLQYSHWRSGVLIVITGLDLKEPIVA